MKMINIEKKCVSFLLGLTTAWFALSGLSSAQAATYYVSKGANASDAYNITEGINNINKPYATINRALYRAITYANGVDTIIVLPGTYDETITIKQPGLTVQAQYDANSPSTSQANRSIIKPVGAGLWNIVSIVTQNVVFRGFEVDGSSAYVDTGTTAGTYGAATNAVLVYGAHTDYSNNPVAAAQHVVVSQCIVHDAGGGGICTQNDNYLTDPALEGPLAGGCDYVTIEDNTIYNNSYGSRYESSGISFHGNSNLNTDDTSFHCVIQRNRLYGNACKFVGVDAFGSAKHTDGNGIIVDTCGHQNPPTLIRNNLVYLNGGRGIHVFASSNVTAINNTVYKNNQDPDISKSGGGELTAISAHNVLYSNNVVYGPGGNVPAFAAGAGYAYGKAGGVNQNIAFRSCTYWGSDSGSAKIAAGVIDSNTVFNSDPLFHAPDSGDFTIDVAPTIQGKTPSQSQFVIDRASTIPGDFATDDITGAARPTTGIDRGAYERALPIVIPTLTVAGASSLEGNSSTTPVPLNFAVSLGAATDSTVTVNYATTAGTATAGTDYTTTNGTLTIAAGQTSGTIAVPMVGDTIQEPNETFSLTLSSLSGAVFASGTTLVATGTIQNDDSAPVITLRGVTQKEGNSGTSIYGFKVLLSSPSTSAISMSYATADDTATAGSDYVAANSTLTIPAGSTSGFINITVNGDTTAEPDERFNLNLTNPGGATFINGVSTLSARGNILNDDADATPIATDVTSQVTVYKSGLSRNRSTGRYVMSLVIQNNGASLDGPLSLAMDGLDSNISLYNATGYTSRTTPAGSPYMQLTLPGVTVQKPNGLLVAGTALTVSVEFVNPDNAALTFTPRVLQGTGL